MKTKPLAPLEWPSSRSLREVPGTSLATMLENPEHIRRELHAALAESYLPNGVLLIVAAEVTPLDAELETGNRGLGTASSGLIANGFEHLAELMASTIAWNKEHRRSYFQRLSEYAGSLASVAVFQRPSATLAKGTPFHVAQFVFQGAATTPAAFPAEAKYGDLALPRDSRPQRQMSGSCDVRLIRSTDEIEFAAFSEKIARDQPYLDHVASFIPHANLVLAAPRVFYGGAEFQRRLGAMGLNVLFHPAVAINRELLIRVYLLADRLNAMFHLSAAARLDGQLSGAARAFGIVEHSLKNARTHSRTGDIRVDAVLDAELLNVKGARALLTRRWTTEEFSVATARTLEQSLADYGESDSVSLDTTALYGRTVSHAFVALLIEMARNHRKVGKKDGGRLEIVVSGDGEASIVASTRCNCADAERLRRGVGRGVPRGDGGVLEGMQVLLILCDLLSGPASEVSFEIDCPSHGVEPVASFSLPTSGAVVTCRFGEGVAAMLSDSQDTDVRFESRTEVSGLRLV